MLTTEIIKAVATLNGLTDEQVNAIVELSKNDENAVIGNRIGEIYRNMDNTIATATGIQRNGDEKTYNFLERAVKEIVKKSNGYTTQIAELNKEKARLEKVIAEGGNDAETKKALAQAQKDLANVQKQFADVQAELTSANEKHKAELFDLRISQELSTASQGLSFKPELPQTATQILLNQAIAKVKGMKPTYINDGKGGQILAFVDENGQTMRNPQNALNPYTAGELIKKELTDMGVLATTPPTGGGTGNPPAGGSGAVSIAGARTQIEANDIIEKTLMAQGLTRGTKEFTEAMSKAWIDNNVLSLPAQ